MILQPNIVERIINFIGTIYNKVDTQIELFTNNSIKRRLVWCVIFFFCFTVLLSLNILTPLISDDFAYLFIYGEDVRISSIGDIVQSQRNHYFMWGGRSIVHFIAQLLLMLPPLVADLLNAMAYMGYILLIYLHIRGRGRNSMSLFILVNLAVWFMQPVFGDTFLWITGSANYLWGTFLILLFLLPYRLYQGKRGGLTTQFLASLGLFLFGVIAGWTNENTAGAMILIIVFLLFYFHSKKWSIPMWSMAGLIGVLIGYTIMILAPGNLVRAGDASSLNLFILVYRLFNCTLMFFEYCGSLILVSLITLILYYHYPNSEKKESLPLAFIYVIAAVAAVYAMLLSPSFPRRALFGVVTYLMIGCGILFNNLNARYKFLKQIIYVVVLVGVVSFIFTFYQAFKETKSFRDTVDQREIIIKEAKETGISSCEFEQYMGGKYTHGEDPYSEVLMSRYYGIKIKLVTPQN